MDYLVCLLLLGVFFINNGFNREAIFAIGTLSLWFTSMMFPKQREMKSVLLLLFFVACLIPIFLHLDTDLMRIYPVNKYLNIYVMASGVASLVFGTVLLRLIVEYHKTLIPYVVIAPIMLIKYDGVFTRYTVVMSLLIAVIFYLVKKKKYFHSGLALSLIMLYVLGSKATFWMKLQARYYGYLEALSQIAQHPFKGIGFDSYFVPLNMVWANKNNYGWVFIHNDFLALARCIGILAPALLIAFLAREAWKLRNDWRIIIMASVLLTVSLQETMFNIHKAALAIALVAIAVSKNYEVINES